MRAIYFLQAGLFGFYTGRQRLARDSSLGASSIMCAMSTRPTIGLHQSVAMLCYVAQKWAPQAKHTFTVVKFSILENEQLSQERRQPMRVALGPMRWAAEWVM